MNSMKQWIEDNLCKLVQIAYHLVFVTGMTLGGSHYVSEIEKTRDEALKEVRT